MVSAWLTLTASSYPFLLVTVPVNESVSAVILKAEKDSKPVGAWSGAYEKCNNSAVYNLTSLNNTAFQTNWTVPSSEDVTKVNLT